MRAQLLDPVSLPIQGRCLIEASAGTGKTFTLAALYLRLLLGMGNDQQQRRPLGVEEILVVTFTEAATQELRDRIRVRIREARRAFLDGSSDDPLLQRLVADSSDHVESARDSGRCDGPSGDLHNPWFLPTNAAPTRVRERRDV